MLHQLIIGFEIGAQPKDYDDNITHYIKEKCIYVPNGLFSIWLVVIENVSGPVLATYLPYHPILRAVQLK